MRRAQDAFFDRIYWKPAVRAASRAGIETPLGVTVVYDSHIHGSWGRVRRLTETKIGGIDAAGGEHTWITAYVTTRREWLASRRNAVLRRTVYRMDAFLKLIESDQWALPLPLDIRGVRISPSSLLSDSPREIANAPSTEASSPESANSDRPHTA
jgi:chitosanase